MKYVFPLPRYMLDNGQPTLKQISVALGCSGYSAFKKKHHAPGYAGPMEYLNYSANIHAWFGEKKCKECGEVKQESAFQDAGRRTNGTCNLCKNKRAWQAQKKKYKKDVKLHEKEKARRKRYESYKDPDWYQKNKEAQKRAVREWKARNVDKVNSHRGCRNRKMESIDSIDAYRKIKKDNCYWCGCRLGPDYHMDHIVPISKGGRNIVANIVASCPACNLKKHAKMPNDFIEEGQLVLEMT